jgi:hypothetical protein
VIAPLTEAVVAAARAGAAWEIRLDERRSMMPPGHNGPYFQVETPLRNTANWLVTLSVAHAVTGESDFAERGRRLSAFLKNPGAVRGAHALVHRQSGTDGSNGVIGPAWIIGALARAARHLGDEEAGALAKSELEALPFHHRAGAWHRVDPRTGRGAVDYTYNHQGWLAAAAADVPDCEHTDGCRRFLDRSFEGGLRVHEDGTIHHLFHAPTARARLLLARFEMLRRRRPDAIEAKETGYHLYALVPLLQLQSRFPEHPLFQSEPFQQASRRAQSEEFVAALDRNRYAYPYNAPGFELPLVSALTRESDEQALMIFERQCDRTLDPATGLHTRGCPDPTTLAARIHELALAVEVLSTRTSDRRARHA